MITVRGNRVLVAPEDQSVTEHASGVVIVEDHAPSVMGTIVAVGDVREVAVGNVVLFPPEAGHELEYQAQRYLVFSEDELIAVLE